MLLSGLLTGKMLSPVSETAKKLGKSTIQEYKKLYIVENLCRLNKNLKKLN